MARGHDVDGNEKERVIEGTSEKERVIGSAGKEPGVSGSDEGHERLGRRSFVKLAGASAGAAVLGTTAASANETHHDISFDEVVHAVDDLGMDPNGNEPIDGALSNLSPNTLVEFPDGEYLWQNRIVLGENHASYGLRGIGDDVRIRPPDRANEYLLDAMCGEFLFENIDIDIRADDTVAGMRIIPQNRFHVQDVEWLGRGHNSDFDQQGTVNMYLAGVQNADGLGIFRNVVAKQIGLFGSAYPAGNAPMRGRVGIFAGASHAGTIRFEGCDLREAPNNALYMSRCPGVVQVEDSYFENNNVASIRISGEGSYARNCRIVADMDNVSDHRPLLPRFGMNIRGVLHEQRNWLDKEGPVVVEDCIFEWRSLGPVNSQAPIHVGPSGRQLEVRNCHVDIHTDNFSAVLRRAPDELPPIQTGPTAFHAENLTITGSASDGVAIDLRDADNSVIRNCCIQQDGNGRDGILLQRSNNCTIEDTTVNVSGQDIVQSNSSADTRDVSNDGSCSAQEIDAPTGEDDDRVGEDDGRGDGQEDEEGNGNREDENRGGDNGGNDRQDEDDEEEPSDDDLDRVITITDAWPHTPSNYEFTVSGDVEKSEDDDATIDDEDEIDGSTVTGFVYGWRDSFRFSGEIEDFSVDGPVQVVVDGEEVDPAELASDLSRYVTIESDGGRADYELTVSGDLEKSVDENATIDDEDEIDGSTATGFVHGWKDSYRFSGEIEDISVDGPATVSLDGEEIDPAELVLSNLLTLYGNQGRADYEFTVSGDLEKSEENDASINDHDEIDGSTASGHVRGGRDSYRFSGEITEFEIDAPATIYLNGIEVDPEILDSGLPNLLTITGTHERADYEFAVTGELEKSEEGAGTTIDDEDEIDGSTATGAVHGGRDSFRFSGDVADFEIDGPATIELNGREVDPETLAPDLPNEVTLEGTSDEPTRYQLAVSEGLRKVRRENAEAAVEDGVATGVLDGGEVGFRFAGELEHLLVEGNASVTFDRGA